MTPAEYFKGLHSKYRNLECYGEAREAIFTKTNTMDKISLITSNEKLKTINMEKVNFNPLFKGKVNK